MIKANAYGHGVLQSAKALAEAGWDAPDFEEFWKTGYVADPVPSDFDFLGAFRADACPCGALMPAELGVISWPREGDCLSVLVDETELPSGDELASEIERFLRDQS